MGQGHDENQVAEQIAALSSLDAEDLRRRWQALTGKGLPTHLPRHLLQRLLAYRIQVEVYGDLDTKSSRVLRDIARQRADAKSAGGVPTLESLNLSSRGKRSLAPGTVIGREHGGVMHHVTVLTDGFAWNGRNFSSLSEAAFAITGTRWNGPRFFGLTNRGGQPGSAVKHPTAGRSTKAGAP
jgi:hypothetical protein